MNKSVIAIRCILSLFAIFLTLSTANIADAKSGNFELGVAAGYNYSMALNPTDGNDTPEAIVDGNGFALTISSGARINDYVGVYADFGLNMGFASDDKTFLNQKDDADYNTIIEEYDYLYTFTVMLDVRFFQKVYKGEFVEGIGIGYDYAGDHFEGEEPGSGFAVKVSLGYLQQINEHFELGIMADVISSHKMDRNYFNFSVGASVQTVYHF